MSVASVTIAQGAFSDPRIIYLAKLAGWEEGVDAAIGKLTRLWGRCTHLQSDVLPEYEVCACIGPHGDELLVKAGLAVFAGEGVRIKGRYDNATGRDRFSWFADSAPKVSQRRNGGLARVSNAVRNERGQLVAAGPAKTPADDQQRHQQTSRDQQPQNRGAVQQSSNDQQPGRMLDTSNTSNAQHHQLQVHPDQDRRAVSDRGRDRPPSEADPDQGGGGDRVQRSRLVNRFLSRVNAARVEVATAHNLGPARPITLMDDGGAGELDLRARFASSADPDRDLEHVLDVAIAEAQARGELRWLSWSLATPGAWRTKIASSVAEASAKRAGPRRTNDAIGAARPRNDHPDEPGLKSFRDL